jgi:hypothetical protein
MLVRINVLFAEISDHVACTDIFQIALVCRQFIFHALHLSCILSQVSMHASLLALAIRRLQAPLQLHFARDMLGGEHLLLNIMQIILQ